MEPEHNPLAFAWRDPACLPEAEGEVADEDEIVVPIVRRGNFAFDGRLSGSTQTVVLANAIDVTWWRTAILLFIVHTKNNWLTGGGGPTTGQLALSAGSVSLTPDAPDVTFLDPLSKVTTSSVVQTTVVPMYELKRLNPPFGPQVQVSLTFDQGATVASGPQTIALSCYLLGRAQ